MNSEIIVLVLNIFFVFIKKHIVLHNNMVMLLQPQKKSTYVYINEIRKKTVQLNLMEPLNFYHQNSKHIMYEHFYLFTSTGFIFKAFGAQTIRQCSQRPI